MAGQYFRSAISSFRNQCLPRTGWGQNWVRSPWRECHRCAGQLPPGRHVCPPGLSRPLLAGEYRWTTSGFHPAPQVSVTARARPARPPRFLPLQSPFAHAARFHSASQGRLCQCRQYPGSCWFGPVLRSVPDPLQKYDRCSPASALHGDRMGTDGKGEREFPRLESGSFVPQNGPLLHR